MKHNKYLKFISILWIIAISLISLEGSVCSVYMGYAKTQYTITYQLPAPRESIPPSIQGRVIKTQESFNKQTNTNLDCNRTSLCGTFEGNSTLNDISAWIGFNFEDSTGKYFIATYGQKAKKIGNRIYGTENWDKRHMWINIGKKTVPFPIQLRYVGIDEESGNEWYTVDYIGLRIAGSGTDYSKYSENMSTSALLLLMNPKTKEVIEHHIEYYDENSEYIEDYNIKVGDEIESYFIGFKKYEGDVAYLFSIEDITPVTDTITFSYKEQYPRKDFNCTNCGELDLAQVEFRYMFESYGKTRSTFTETQPIVAKSNISSNNSSTTKSVPLAGFWILFILTIFIAMINLKKDYTHV